MNLFRLQRLGDPRHGLLLFFTSTSRTGTKSFLMNRPSSSVRSKVQENPFVLIPDQERTSLGRSSTRDRHLVSTSLLVPAHVRTGRPRNKATGPTETYSAPFPRLLPSLQTCQGRKFYVKPRRRSGSCPMSPTYLTSYTLPLRRTSRHPIEGQGQGMHLLPLSVVTESKSWKL